MPMLPVGQYQSFVDFDPSSILKLSPTMQFPLSSVLVMCLGAMLYHVSARPQEGGAYQFPANVDSILSAPVQQTFDCTDREYGYYADVDNNCEIFHICLPIQDNDGNVIETSQYSFVCGNQTIFDQQTLTCNYASDAFPCAEAPSLYNTIEFGKVEE